MKSEMRRVCSYLILAFALVLGQQVGALHNLAHTFERISAGQDQQLPGANHCDECSACSQLSGAVASSCLEFRVPAAQHHFALFSSTPAASRLVVASRSRAPPILL